MSTGNPKFDNPNNLFVVPRTEEFKKQLEHLDDIPLSFFIVHRYKNSLIKDVCFSRELSQKISIARGIYNDDSKAAGEEIKKRTGFYSESLSIKLMKLRQKYIGKTEAPLFTENEDELRIF